MGAIRQLIILLCYVSSLSAQTYSIGGDPLFKQWNTSWDSITIITFDGQSNCVGWASDISTVKWLFKDSLQRVDNVYIFNENKKIENINVFSGNTDIPYTSGVLHFSSEANLANHLSDNGNTYLFVKYGVGSTGIHLDTTELNWNAAAVGNLLDLYLSNITQAISQIGATAKIKKIIRIKFQGEDDCGGATYVADETAIIAKYNAAFSGYTVRHLLIRLINSDGCFFVLAEHVSEGLHNGNSCNTD